MKRSKSVTFCMKGYDGGLTFENHIYFDFHQFICLGPKGSKLLKINSSLRNEAKID